MSDLLAAIATAHGAARDAWPGIEVDLARFEAELRRRLGDALATELPRISTRDVYLAIACLDGDEAAIALLERDFVQELQFAARRLRATEAMAADVRGHLQRILFTAEQDRGAALAAFTGRAKLKDYLRVVASRELVRTINRARREVPIEPLLERLRLENEPEIALLKNRHGAELSVALRDALARLDERQRALLRYSVVEGASIDRIGEMYGVSRSSAARWVAAARDALVQHLRDEVAARLAIPVEDVDSVIRVVRSRIDISLERIL
ncbi:MAG TPA: sigma factor-like helix-turn-helix DNA-binding protein [Kofleriaceae bacterium]